MPRPNSKERKLIESKQREIAHATLGENYLQKIKEENKEKNFLKFIDRYVSFKFRNPKTGKKIKQQLQNEYKKGLVNHSEFESVHHKRILHIAQSIYLKYNGHFKNKDLPYIATIYSNGISAEINDHNDFRRPVIFFHGELFTANLLLCKLFAQSIPYDTESKANSILFIIDEAQSTLKASNIAHHIIQFFHNSAKHYPHSADQYLVYSDIEEKITYDLIESISLFIFSHEMGHHVNKHFERYYDKTDAEKIQDEKEADLYALNQIINRYKKDRVSNPFLLMGPLIFFYYLIFLETVNPARYSSGKTHPSAFERKYIYETMLFNFIDDDKEALVRDYIQLIKNVITSFTALLKV